MPRLTDEELQLAPSQVAGWRVAQGTLECRLTFPTFADAIAFANRVADLAEDLQHYPQLCVVESTVTLRLLTPSEQGVTERDIYLARRINALLGR